MCPPAQVQTPGASCLSRGYSCACELCSLAFTCCRVPHPTELLAPPTSLPGFSQTPPVQGLPRTLVAQGAVHPGCGRASSLASDTPCDWNPAPSSAPRMSEALHGEEERHYWGGSCPPRLLSSQDRGQAHGLAAAALPQETGARPGVSLPPQPSGASPS